MNLSLTNKASFFILFLVTILLAPLTASSATEEATDWLDEPINLSFQNEPLSNVLKHISQQTGISIAYDQKLANDKISGNYQDVKASDAITRLFKSKNKSIQVNKEKKIIVIKTFGAKNFIWASRIQEKNKLSQITLEQLTEMHTQQYKEFKERIADNNEILDGGMTRGQIKDMHKKQYDEFQKRIIDDSEILDGGMTRGQIKNMHKKQYDEFQKRIIDDSEILDGGMTRGQIKDMQKQQYDEFQASLGNNEISFEGSMTRDEIVALHKKQYKEISEELKDTSIIKNKEVMK